MITINNKSRYFSASEDMFPTMERNFAWLFGMQTPEQGWKAAMAKAIYRSARASSAEEWQYGFPIGDDGEPIMDIFGNFPYLFPIMVTGWLAMQACSKMVTGSADLKD